jgi:hypothetical protein
MHGGTQPRGLAHPNTRHGRISKDLPTRLVADYHAALQDEDLMALRGEMALVVSREADLIRRVDTGEAGALWRSAQRAIADFRVAQRTNDAPAAAVALKAIEQAITDGVADYQAWDELLKTVEHRRRLADTERRRLEALEQSVTKKQALLLAGALIDAVRRHVHDRRTLAAIGLEFGRILGDDRGGA